MPDKMSNITNEGTSASIFSNNYCGVPYQSPFSYDDHEKIRLRIEDFLFKNNLMAPKRMEEIHQTHLTLDEWRMIESTPERYWPVLYAKKMNGEERALVERKVAFNTPEARHRFHKSLLEWFGTAEKIYAQTHDGAWPDTNSEINLALQLGAEHHTFFALAEGIAGLVVDDPWAERVYQEVQESRRSRELVAA